jgi:hypothetical protein
MAVFNKKNALIGWAVMEGARIAAGRRSGAGGKTQAPVDADEKKPRRARRALAAVTGAAVATGGTVILLRRRKSTPDTEE